MNTNAQAVAVNPECARKNICIKVFGVGKAGAGVLEEVVGSGLAIGSACTAVDTDAESLGSCAVEQKAYLEPKRQDRLRSEGDPARGREAAEENLSSLKSQCDGADIVFICAGLGGGAGTGISPVLARAAR